MDRVHPDTSTSGVHALAAAPRALRGSLVAAKGAKPGPFPRSAPDAVHQTRCARARIQSAGTDWAGLGLSPVAGSISGDTTISLGQRLDPVHHRWIRSHQRLRAVYGSFRAPGRPLSCNRECETVPAQPASESSGAGPDHPGNLAPAGDASLRGAGGGTSLRVLRGGVPLFRWNQWSYTGAGRYSTRGRTSGR